METINNIRKKEIIVSCMCYLLPLFTQCMKRKEYIDKEDDIGWFV